MNHCDRCHGDGWVLDDDLNAAPCDTCDGIPTRVPDDYAQALSALTDAHGGTVPVAVVDALEGVA